MSDARSTNHRFGGRYYRKQNRYREGKTAKVGLQEALTAENKGFVMLQKIGYQTGTPLGVRSDGIIEPIPINFKSQKRAGLGMKTIAAPKSLKEVAENKRTLLDRSSIDKAFVAEGNCMSRPESPQRSESPPQNWRNNRNDGCRSLGWRDGRIQREETRHQMYNKIDEVTAVMNETTRGESDSADEKETTATNNMAVTNVEVKLTSGQPLKAHQADIIEESIIEGIDRCIGRAPQIFGSKYTNGTYQISLCGRSSYEWLEDHLPKITGLGTNSELMMGIRQEITKPALCKIKLRDDIDENLVLRRLKLQNPYLNTEKWIVERSHIENRGAKILMVWIDSESMMYLRAFDFRVFFGVAKISVNPYCQGGLNKSYFGKL